MESIGFDGLRTHRVIHTNLLKRLDGHRAEVVARGTASDELFDFLRFWLASHICGIDTKYAEAAHANHTV